MNSLVVLPLVAAPVPAPVLTATALGNELLELERAFFSQVHVYEVAMDETSAALDRFDEQTPARPDALRVDYKRDFACFDGLAGRWRNRIEDIGGYWPADAIEQHLRNWPCEKVWTKTKNMDGTDLDRDLTDEDIAGVDFLEVEERTPDLDARARVDEIVSAYDRREAEWAKLRRVDRLTVSRSHGNLAQDWTSGHELQAHENARDKPCRVSGQSQGCGVVARRRDQRR